MPGPQRSCTECGELITAQRLTALPGTQLCFDCANQASTAAAVTRAKPIAPKPTTSTFHLKRYLSNVGQKTDQKALSRMVLRLNYLFHEVSVAEMIPVLIKWSRDTNSGFDQEQIRQMVVAARNWVLEHPSKKP